MSEPMELFTLAQAAELLGVHRATLHRYVKKGTLQAVLRLGNRSYYSRAQIEALPPVRMGRPRKEGAA